MGWLFALVAAGWAGEITVTVQGSARLRVDDRVLAEAWAPGSIRVEVPDGTHDVVVVVDGLEHRFPDRTVDAAHPLQIFAGRLAVTEGVREAAPAQSGEPTSPPAAVGPSPVAFRGTGAARVLVQLDDTRFYVDPGQSVQRTLSPGDHRVSVRSSDGLSIYARGALSVRADATGALVVQVAEGTVPEAGGDGLRFTSEDR
jgi:hypothetical protein